MVHIHRFVKPVTVHIKISPLRYVAYASCHFRQIRKDELSQSDASDVSKGDEADRIIQVFNFQLTFQ